MSKILVLNGPNVATIGVRQPEVYGNTSIEQAMDQLRNRCEEANVDIEIIMTNHEGVLLDRLQPITLGDDGDVAAIIVNPGGLTAYSVPLRDALKATRKPVVVVHVSNRSTRTDGDFRQRDVIAGVSVAQVVGMGVTGYEMALEWCLRHAL